MPMNAWPLALVLAGGLLAGCANEPMPDTPEARFEALGRRTYKSACITCHQADGRGLAGVYPTLHQTEWTEGDKGRLIRLVLHGMRGPVKVGGQTYDGWMQPLGRLSDDQIAAVLTFVRQSFGNDASVVTPDEVTRVRAATAGRSEPWHPDALWQTTGIPGAPADSLPAAP